MSHRISTCSAEAFALTLPFSLGHEITVVAPRYYSYKYCKLHIWATFSIVFQHKPDRYLFKGKPIAGPIIYSSIFWTLVFQAVFRFASLFICRRRSSIFEDDDAIILWLLTFTG